MYPTFRTHELKVLLTYGLYSGFPSLLIPFALNAMTLSPERLSGLL